MRLSRGGPAVLVVAGLVLTGCSSSSSGAEAPPVTRVTESFTLLPCPEHANTTLQLEGCAEHRIVKLDRRINEGFDALVLSKSTSTTRKNLTSAQVAWISYRKAQCTSEADVYDGGTLAPVGFANCEVRIDRARLADLAAMRTP